MKFQHTIFLFSFILFACQSTKKSVISVEKDIPTLSEQRKNEFINHHALSKYVESAPTVIPNNTLGSPFDTLKYDKVIAYDFDGRHEKYYVIEKYGWFVNTISKQQYLTQKQTDKLVKALTNKSSYGESTAACFEPHFAVVFFKNNKMVNQVNVCLDCNYLMSTIEIPAQSAKTIVMDSISYPMNGFSKKGVKAVTSLCKELNFLYGTY